MIPTSTTNDREMTTADHTSSVAHVFTRPRKHATSHTPAATIVPSTTAPQQQGEVITCIGTHHTRLLGTPPGIPYTGGHG
jgi:hypothetical protein